MPPKIIKQKQILKVQSLLKNSKLNEAHREALKLLKIDGCNVILLKMLVEINVLLDDLNNQEIYILRLLQLNPNDPALYNDLAGVYAQIHEYDRSEEMYLKAIENADNSTEIHGNLANLYHRKKQYNKAEKFFQLAINNEACQDITKIAYSMFLLKNREYDLGFDLYRQRYSKHLSSSTGELLSQDKALSRGTDIKGKRIFLTQGQGPGDLIIFMRYINLFEKMGAEVFVQPNKDLYRLYNNNYKNTIIKGNEIEVDYHLPLIDAAYFFGTKYDTIPLPEGYLLVDSIDSVNIHNKYFRGVSKKKIGIVWRSNPTKSESISISRKRAYKNAPLELFLKYFNTDEVQLYSLQYEVNDEERKLLESHNISSLGDDFEDFYDNALVIDNLDSLITIETASLILAGSMGKESTAMIAYHSFWLWGRDDKKTNWFASMNLARETSEGNWESAFKGALEIENLLSIPFKDLMQRALKFHTIGDIEAAEELYRKILSVEENNADAYHYLGVIASQTGNKEQAIDLINHAIVLNPNLNEAKDNLHKILG